MLPLVNSVARGAGPRTVHVTRRPRRKLGLTLADESGSGGVVISKVHAGYACDHAGVRSGEMLISVNGVTTSGMSPAEVSALVQRQPPGAIVMQLARPRASAGPSSQLPPVLPPQHQRQPQQVLHSPRPSSLPPRSENEIMRWRTDPLAPALEPSDKARGDLAPKGKESLWDNTDVYIV